MSHIPPVNRLPACIKSTKQRLAVVQTVIVIHEVVAIRAHKLKQCRVKSYSWISDVFRRQRYTVVHDIPRPIMAFLAQAAIDQDPLLYIGSAAGLPRRGSVEIFCKIFHVIPSPHRRPLKRMILPAGDRHNPVVQAAGVAPALTVSRYNAIRLHITPNQNYTGTDPQSEPLLRAAACL